MYEYIHRYIYIYIYIFIFIYMHMHISDVKYGFYVAHPVHAYPGMVQTGSFPASHVRIDPRRGRTSQLTLHGQSGAGVTPWPMWLCCFQTIPGASGSNFFIFKRL